MKLKVHLIIAAVAALAIVLFEVLLNHKGLVLQGNYVYVCHAILLAGLLTSTYFFAQANGRGLPFGQYFSNCFRMMALTILLVVIGRIITFHTVPGMHDRLFGTMKQQLMTERMAADSSNRALLARPAPNQAMPRQVDTATHEQLLKQVDQSMQQADQNFNISLAAGTVFLYAIPGIVAALLSSLIFARRKTA